MLGLLLYEATLCSGCKLPPSVTADPAGHVFQIENSVCPACRSMAQFGRVQADNDKRAWDARGDKAPPASPHPSDGRHTHLRKLTALEAATRRPGPSTAGVAGAGAAGPPASRRGPRRPAAGT